ncbi:MAG: hypothetical protein DRR08_07790 [Candidatus Parabeggiatoa sp. nov. 2]|nr:MAG: hypothetical protein DRR08_07790 [Gammaproteobacteria bacterium]
MGQALGQMVHGKKFPRASVVILDADLDKSPGCLLLPGYDAPERANSSVEKSITILYYVILFHIGYVGSRKLHF